MLKSALPSLLTASITNGLLVFLARTISSLIISAMLKICMLNQKYYDWVSE